MKPENLILAIAAAFVGIKLFGKSADEQAHDQAVKDLLKKPLPVPPGRSQPPAPQLSAAEAKAIAERQYIAMWRPGTDEGELFRSLNGLNGADLRQVYAQFGRRNYYNFRRPLDLFGWYVEELTPAELSEMRLIWRKAGVTF